MKVLAFTDMHGSSKAMQSIRAKSKNVDMIFCCGDITIFEQELEKTIKKLDSLQKPVLIIPGNHETPEALEEICEKTKNIHFLDDSFYETREHIILGAEGNGFSTEDKQFKKNAKKFKKILAKRKDKKFILITHAPPYGTNHDLMLENHCGNKDIRKFIEETQPLYAFCGHIHENSYTKDRIKNTLTSNPGPRGRIFNI